MKTTGHLFGHYLSDFSAASEWFADNLCELVPEPTLVRLSPGVSLTALNEGRFTLCLFILSDLVSQMSKTNCEAK